MTAPHRRRRSPHASGRSPSGARCASRSRGSTGRRPASPSTSRSSSTSCSSASPTGSWCGARCRPAGRAECSRCLRELDRRSSSCRSTSSSSPTRRGRDLPLEGHELDLEQLVRDALAARAARSRPLCRDDCAGRRRPCRRPTTSTCERRRRPARSPVGALSSELDLSTTEPGAGHRWPSPSARPRVQDAHAARVELASDAAPARSICPNCGAAKLPHIVCGNCGWYRGRQAIDVD